ncbi:MAG TPA: DinB family protein [Bacteroidetes bacterium]|nr:DinB family protein [Bacteroidota bacterium]
MQIINGLKTTRDRTLVYFDLSDEYLGKTYAAGKWSVRELLNHIVDAETVLYERIRRGISKPEQVAHVPFVLIAANCANLTELNSSEIGAICGNQPLLSKAYLASF